MRNGSATGGGSDRCKWTGAALAACGTEDKEPKMGESRNEQFLEAWRDGATITVEPRSRNEKWLATIAGMTGIECDEPRSRIEYLLSQIAEAGGGGGGGALKMGVLRPDAELVKSWTYDKMIVADEGKTIPAYSTSARTLLSEAELTPTQQCDFSTYDYYIMMRSVAWPIYDTEFVIGEYSQQLFTYTSRVYEVLNIPPNTIAAKDGSKYSNWIVSPFQQCGYELFFYQSKSSGGIFYSTTLYGAFAEIQSPSVSNNTSFSIKSPRLKLTGSASYFTSDVYSHITDIRYQYVIELYRVEKGAANIDGWGLQSQTMHVLDCIQSESGKLT